MLITNNATEIFNEAILLVQQDTKYAKLQAIEKLTQVLETENKKEQILTLLWIGKVYNELGEKQIALDYFLQSLSLSQELENPAQIAINLNNIAAVYDDLGEKLKALDYYEQSLLLSEELEEQIHRAITLNNIGKIYNDLGEKQKALDYYQQSLSFSQKLGNKTAESVSFNNIGYVYDSLDEKQKALDYYHQSLPLIRALGNKKLEGNIINNIGAIYDSLGDNPKALNFYHKSLPLRQETGDKSGEAITLNNLGKIYAELGETQKALDYFLQSLPLKQEVGNKLGLGITLNNIGAIYDNLGEREKALDYYQQSLIFSRKVQYKSLESITLNNIGAVYDDLGEKQKALDDYQQSLSLSRQVGDKSMEALTLYNMADVYRDQGNLNNALECMKESIDIVEDLRNKIINTELKTSYFATFQEYYQFYIKLLMESHNQDTTKGDAALALNISERSRARVLLELLKEAKIDIKKGITEELLQQEKNLQTKIEQVEQARIRIYTHNPNNRQIELIEKQRKKIFLEYAELQATIRSNSPIYAAITQPQPLTLEEIQETILDEDTVLLEYFLSKKKSFLWMVTPDTMNSYELPSSEEIGVKVGEFRREITNNDTSIKKVQNKSLLLSQIILAPVIDKIGNKRLLIVADGSLQYIPFNALQNPNETEKYTPLILTNEIITLPSISTIKFLRENQQIRPDQSKQIAVIADPVFTKNDDRLPQTPSQNLDDEENLTNTEELGLERLKATRQEAEEIKKLIRQNEQIQVLDFDANLNFVKNHDLDNYKIIHFATHGIANSNSPELSGLVLSLFDDQGNPQAGFLKLNDIFNLKLNADLVVLSACQTGLGKQVKGEGLVGLTRGFMYAGTSRVVVSLWNIDDQGTSILMSRFYQLMLEEKLTISQSLRQAQIEIFQQENYKLPYYWAAFIIQGEWK